MTQPAHCWYTKNPRQLAWLGASMLHKIRAGDMQLLLVHNMYVYICTPAAPPPRRPSHPAPTAMGTPRLTGQRMYCFVAAIHKQGTASWST
jgi:hypothetical protein